MVVTRLVGGLGNQLFQYAAGLNLARLNKVSLKLDTTDFDTYRLHAYSLDHFNIDASIAEPKDLKRFRRTRVSAIRRRLAVEERPGVRRHRGDTWVSEVSMEYDPEILSVKGNVYLDGYWQSEKYFLRIQDALRRELTIIPAPSSENREMAARIRHSSSVSVHVRLGDFASDPLTKAVHGLLEPQYYIDASRHLLGLYPDIHFFLFSDAPREALTRAALPPERTTIVDLNSAETSYEDLRLMALCDHHIVANSTFSWWGAWLGTNPEGISIAPVKWFADETRNSRDIVPERWLRL